EGARLSPRDGRPPAEDDRGLGGRPRLSPGGRPRESGGVAPQDPASRGSRIRQGSPPGDRGVGGLVQEGPRRDAARARRQGTRARPAPSGPRVAGRGRHRQVVARRAQVSRRSARKSPLGVRRFSSPVSLLGNRTGENFMQTLLVLWSLSFAPSTPLGTSQEDP